MFSLFDAPFYSRRRLANPWYAMRSFFDDDPFFYPPVRRHRPMSFFYDFDGSGDEGETNEQPQQHETAKPEPEQSKQRRQEIREPVCIETKTRRYIDGNGVEHTIEEHRDSRSGMTRYKEVRRMGDRAMTLMRETDKEGKVTEHEMRTNLKDEEVARFQEEWNSLLFNKPQQESLEHAQPTQEGEEKAKTE
mgnify:CR=1 FL=1